ncbi:maestro heat-like repeat-containing protein family member 1 [Dysidea avara]|uniref:maestro heat-like repeat-containing protein family member 1 n=1 Tax=Dysidea avara TaxID=196820 RepID=UPI00332DCDE6
MAFKVAQVGAPQIDNLTESLVDSIYDRSEVVAHSISKALQEIARNKPIVVLKISCTYLTKHVKLHRNHRILILRVMDNITREYIKEINDELAKDMIALGSRELTLANDVIPTWQSCASELLSTLGRRFAIEVMKELLSKFRSGVMPHFFVVKTLGTLATSNVEAMVPHLREVIARMLPLLGIAKHDNMQWVFSSTFARICESIIDFYADEQRGDKAELSNEDYAGEVYSAYDILFNNWLKTSKEARIRLAVAEAIGFAVHLLSQEQLNAQLPSLVHCVLSLYKKHSDHYYISQCMFMIVEAAIKKECIALNGLMDVILVTLHQYSCVPVDTTNSISIKNNHELLRCFAVAADGFAHRVISFLLSKLEPNQERIRMTTLNIFKHLINSCVDALEEEQPLIVSGLRIILNEQNFKVRSVFSQVIIAMAHHQYLAHEGAQMLIEYIVRQCGLNTSIMPKPGPPSPDPPVSPTQLRNMNENILLLMTTTIDHMSEVLWPYLLEFIVPEQYTRGFAMLTRCIHHIASKKRAEEAEDYEIDFDVAVNLPKPEQMLARLIVLCGNPLNGRNRGEHVINCMASLVPNIHEDIVELWDAVTPKLLSYLNEHQDDEVWDQKHWEDLVLKFLSRSLDDINDEDWLVNFGSVLGGQVVKLYNEFPEEKGFGYKCLGVVMRKSSHKKFVQDHLKLMFSSVKHYSQIEREGCAIGTGFCAASHLDMVVEQLEHVIKEDMVRKGKSLFGLVKDKSEADVEKIKATVMLCYGYVTFHSPVHLITSRVEVNILRSINPHFAKVKDTAVKQNLIRTIDLIGKALHPDHLKTTNFIFAKRSDLIEHLLNYIRLENSYQPVLTETRALSMHACATLVKLQPGIPEAEQFEIAKVATDHLLAVPFLSSTNKKVSEGAIKDCENYTKDAFNALHQLLVELLLKEITSDNLESIYKHLEHWMQSSEEIERRRATECLYRLLVTYYNELEQNPFEGTHELPLQGRLIGRLVPRCSDPSVQIRKTSLECVQIVLKIATCAIGTSDKLVDAIDLLKERAEDDDPNALFALVNDLSKVLCKKISDDNLWSMVSHLLEGLADYQSHSSSGSCVVLNGIVKTRVSTLTEQLPDLIDQLHIKLADIVCSQTRTGTLRCMRTLAHQQTLPTLQHMLTKTIPYDQNLISMWKVMIGDKQLAKIIFEQLLEVLALTLPYQERDFSGTLTRIETHTAKAVTAALCVLVNVEEVESVVREMFPRFFADLLLRIGVSAELQLADPKRKQKQPSAAQCAVDAFKELLKTNECEVLLSTMSENDVDNLVGAENTLPHGMLFIARGISTDKPDHVPAIVDGLQSSLSSVYDGHRVAVVSFYSELVSTLKSDQLELAELLMNSLLGRQVDNSYVVRMYSIRGLGNMADIEGNQVGKFSTTVLSAMLAGMDDKEDPDDLITMEAMSGLAKIFEQIDEKHVRPILINIALRIRPCFEKPAGAVRAAAFRLFGSLSRFGKGHSKGPFLEQIQTNFVSVLLHLNEDEEEVKSACKTALIKLGPLMGSVKVNEMFQKHLDPDAPLLYPDFLNDLCKHVVIDFKDKVNFYVMGAVSFFKSTWSRVKCNAALLVGYMLGNLPTEYSSVISKEHICEALILLLKDPSDEVRISTAEAMSLLHGY